MIKVSVMYPNQEGTHFDIAYYCSTHMNLVRKLLGPALVNIAVDEGIAGATPGTPAPFVAVGHLYFESVEKFQEAFGPHFA
jgi:uncharacterized protein (TIGR02118 family)